MLTHFIMDHGIWADVQAWKECIAINIKDKMEESSERTKRRQQQKAAAESTSKFMPNKNIFGKGFGKIKTMMQSKEQKFNEEVFKHQNLIFNELSRYVLLLCNFNVPFDDANQLLLHFCQYYQMDKSKMQILLTELMSNQKNTASMFSEQEKNYWSLMKRSERLRKFGHSNMTTILGMTIKFIDSDRVLRYIVSLNRDLNAILRFEVLKQSLLRADMQDIELKRRDLWLQVLTIDPVVSQQQFQHYLEQVPRKLPQDVHQFIDQDVRRSFNQMEGMTHDNVRNVLKAYALTNPRLNYSQGMNFVAGFLYLTMRPEEVVSQ